MTTPTQSAKDRVVIFDTTLRDGEQCPGATMTFEEKLEVAELLVLKATAVIHGDIVTGKLVVEPGAIFNGTCKMGAAVKDIKIAENGAQTRTLAPQQEAIKSI